MRFVLFALLSFASFVLSRPRNPNTFSCTKEFWPKLNPGELFTVSATCKYFPGYHAKTIEGTKVSVAYTEKWERFATKHQILDKTSAILDDALAKSLTYYGKDLHDTLPPEIVVILSTRPFDPYAADTLFPVPEEGICQVRTFHKWTTWIGPHDNWAKQALAHELYHCVQQYKLGRKSASPGSLWVDEGSANYFSNLVFPKTNYEWPSPERYYDPTVPIFAQVDDHVYGTSVFFQALEQPRGIPYLNNWVMSTDEQDTGNGERNRLSKLNGFVDDFFTFAKQYTPGPVIDSGGGPIDGLIPITPKTAPVTAGPSPGTQIADLANIPFTITVFQLSIAPGSIAKLLSYDFAHERMAYRFSDKNDWNDMGIHTTVSVPCGDDSTPVTMFLLFISTKNSDQDKASVLVMPGPDAPCPCKSTNNLRPRDANSTCPSPPKSSTPSGGSGSCKATNLNIDPCLTSHDWKLDLATMKALILKQEAKDGVTSVDLSGSGTVSFTAKAAHFAYKNFNLDIVIKIEGTDYPTNTVVDGDFDATVVTTNIGSGSTGDMCLIVTDGQGSAKITALGTTITQDLGVDGDYVSPDYDIKYTCSADSLTMQGYQNGKSVWGPLAYVSSK
jgi:hypothetical protein